MELIRGVLVKQYEENKQHFIERLKERYGIEISSLEYEIFCTQFKGKFKKNSFRTVGFIFMYNVKVWCLYLNTPQSLITAYPPSIEFSVTELIKACISKPIRHLAFYVYEQYLEEKNLIPYSFGSEKHAAKYYFTKTMFPALHIDLYKYGNVEAFKVVTIINNILTKYSPYAELKLVNKNK